MSWVTGIDVSLYQGNVDWKKAKDAGVKVAIIRLGIGISKDKKFDENFAGAREAGIDLVSAYHVFYPAYDPLAQANFVNQELQNIKLDFHLYADVEIAASISPLTYSYRLKKYLDAIEYKYKGIYTRGIWWNTNLCYYYKGEYKPYYDWSKYRLWIARYNETITHPWLDDPVKLQPAGFKYYQIWQYSADNNGKGLEYGAESWSIDLNRVKKGYYEIWKWKKMAQKYFLPIVNFGK